MVDKNTQQLRPYDPDDVEQSISLLSKTLEAHILKLPQLAELVHSHVDHASFLSVELFYDRLYQPGDSNSDQVSARTAYEDFKW
jgi:hypothetical protein